MKIRITYRNHITGQYLRTDIRDYLNFKLKSFNMNNSSKLMASIYIALLMIIISVMYQVVYHLLGFTGNCTWPTDLEGIIHFSIRTVLTMFLYEQLNNWYVKNRSDN